ncbi:MAG: CBS domain-containing protein [Deltaproteobacteria bacterium]|nr:CBS domain-containing protein [Deltaproteobacteria bacterium]
MEARVKALMSGDPVSVDADASALEAFERMWERGIRHLPVCDAERRVIGVLSIEDVRAALPFPISLRRALAPGERAAAREWRVGEIMSHAPETLGPEQSVAEAAERMAEHRIGCLPIVDDEERLVGLLSETDVLWALATSLGLRRDDGRRGRAADLAALVAELEREREQIRTRLERSQAGERELEQSERELPLDEAERGADRAAIEAARTLDEMALQRLAAIDRALDRAGQQQLGVCERCGGSIPVPRLRALPGTTTCIACARGR